jgi:hypothetical protein
VRSSQLHASNSPNASSNPQAPCISDTTAVPGLQPPNTAGHHLTHPLCVPHPAGPATLKLTAPIEDKVDINRLVDRILDMLVSAISVGQILGASYPARHELSARLSTRKIPTENEKTAVNFSSGLPVDIRYDCQGCGKVHKCSTALPSVRLCVIYPLINRTVEAECILDSGCKGVIMCHDVWMNISMPLDEKGSTYLTSAKSEVNRTLGYICNVPFNIGGMEIFLQVQVVQDTPWEVLLGQAFFAHVACVANSKRDGSQTLTLTDPETGNQICIPTKPWPCIQDKKVFEDHQ